MFRIETRPILLCLQVEIGEKIKKEWEKIGERLGPKNTKRKILPSLSRGCVRYTNSKKNNSAMCHMRKYQRHACYNLFPSQDEHSTRLFRENNKVMFDDVTNIYDADLRALEFAREISRPLVPSFLRLNWFACCLSRGSSEN